MRWEEIDAKVPDLEFPAADPHGHAANWAGLRAQGEALVNHLSREVAGLPTKPIDPARARTAIAMGYREAFMTFGFGAGGSKESSERWKGLLGLVAAAYDDWELVATCTGGRALGQKVQRAKTYDADTQGLARHLATVARARLPASHAEVAMTSLRTALGKGKLKDPRVALVAAHVFFKRIAVVPDVPAALKAWLEGKPLALPEISVPPAVADGQDPRTTIFERYVPELTDQQAHARRLEQLTRPPSPYDSNDRAWFFPYAQSDAAVFLFVARQQLPERWAAQVDPLVARWLGAKVSQAAVDERLGEFRVASSMQNGPREVRSAVVWGRAFAPAVRALLVGDAKLVAKLTGGGKLTAFKPGRFFKDDWRKLLRYLATASAPAVRKKLSAADIEPAWLDFLSQRSPAGSQGMKGGALKWTQLLALQAIVIELGGGDTTTAGRELQRNVTGT